MAISFDDSDSAQGTSVSSLSAPAWTNAGDFLIAGMGWSALTPPNYTSMKWGGSGGTTLTQIGSTLTHNTSYKLALARLVAPNTGSYQLYGAVSGTTDELCVGGMTYSGVDQTTPVGTSASNSGTGSSPRTATVNVTAAVNDVVVSMAYGGGAGTCTVAVGSGQTMRWEQENIGGYYANAGTQSEETATGTTVTMSEVFTQADSDNNWGIIGVAVKPSAGAASEVSVFMYHYMNH